MSVTNVKLNDNILLRFLHFYTNFAALKSFACVRKYKNKIKKLRIWQEKQHFQGFFGHFVGFKCNK